MTTVEKAVAFVDLTGFTALTEAHGDQEAATHALALADAACGVATAGVECVKLLGDGAMFAAADTGSLVAAVVSLAGWVRNAALPPLRAGLASGAVQALRTAHGPDYAGTTVNVAARACALAAPGQVVGTATTVAALSTADLAPTPLGPSILRNVLEPVELWTARLVEEARPLDPVCRMPVSPDEAAGRLSHRGVEWLFCTLDCAGRFAANPASYIG